MEAQSFCFCCLIEGENLSEMATSTFLVREDEKPINVLDVYLQTVNATASDLEGHRPQICDKCSIILESTYIFRQMTEQVFKDYIKQSDTTMMAMAPPTPAVKQEPELEIDPDNAKMVEIPEALNETNAEIINNQLLKKSSAQGRFACDTCDKSYSHLSLMKLHRESHTQRFKCPYCPAVYRHRYNLITHNKTHINGTIKRRITTHPCQQCSQVFRSPGGLTLHKQVCHQNVRYTCKLCDSEYRNMMGLWRHAFDHLPFQPFNCPYDSCNGFQSRHKPMFIAHLKKIHHTKYQESVHGFKMSTKEILAYVRKTPMAT
jgi:Zinc finger, C2H2 type